MEEFSEILNRLSTVENVLARLVQQGVVTDVNNEKRIARVKFLNTGIRSGWLHVAASPPFIPDYDAPQRTEYEEGGTGWPEFENHKHNLTIKPWMPKINETVLVLYLPIKNSDGYILGRV